MAEDWDNLWMRQRALCPRCNRRTGVQAEAAGVRFVFWHTCGTTWSHENTVLTLNEMYKQVYSRKSVEELVALA